MRCCTWTISRTPPPINEAVELAKGYDEPETVAFVNGVLGGFMRGELGTEIAASAETEE